MYMYIGNDDVKDEIRLFQQYIYINGSRTHAQPSNLMRGVDARDLFCSSFNCEQLVGFFNFCIENTNCLMYCWVILDSYHLALACMMVVGLCFCPINFSRTDVHNGEQ